MFMSFFPTIFSPFLPTVLSLLDESTPVSQGPWLKKSLKKLSLVSLQVPDGPKDGQGHKTELENLPQSGFANA